eukprot:GHUV01040564.1.p1 GENE.GHUV01040564.1~~GHUV01040564.1.p1  ORF type:complete len:120 (-),score=21.32 GHUV01040564.1:33-392(-)
MTLKQMYTSVQMPCCVCQVTIPENGQSFALIYSIEDPGNANSPVGGVGIQVMGPDDGYICQFSKDIKPFWASRHNLELGAVLKPSPTASSRKQLRAPVSEVSTLFSASPCELLIVSWGL